MPNRSSRSRQERTVYTARRLTPAARLGILGVLVVLAGLVVAVNGIHFSSARSPAGSCDTAKVLDTWPLPRLANQTIVVPAQESDVNPLSAAAKDGYGGLILFGSSAPPTLRTELAHIRGDAPHDAGWIVMTDEEGGGVQRMANLAGSMPWASQMGATMTPSKIEALAKTVGEKMAAAGVTMDLAPVLDVDGRAVEPGPADPDGYRSFSGDEAKVSADGVAFMKGLLAAHEVPVVKHFPGLGSATGNTDDTPAYTLPWYVLQSSGLKPFEAAIAAGAPAVMVSNAIVPGLTKDPASISGAAVTGELRGHLGFKGLVITDSLSAKAISELPLSVPQAAARALEAGDDMVLYDPTGTTSGDLALASSISKAIVAAVDQGALSRAELVGAAGHVLEAAKVDACA